MKVIITGATGLVGSAVVRQALQSNEFTSVVALSRNPLKLEEGIDQSRLKNVIIKDYGEYPEDVKKELANADGCIWTVAITPMRSRSLPWDEVKKVCQTNTMAGMEAIHGAGINKPFRFLYMSGAAAPRDQTQKPRFMADYGLMRGQTENMVLEYAAKNGWEAAVAKPGLIIGDSVLHTVLGGFLRVTNMFPSLSLVEIAAGMLHQIANGFETEPLTSEDLQRAGRAALQDKK
ncbi:hypothetical protein E8E14_005417 [Neopestalotiopsis sp. 37M]|nr:hypothetical protein E8E14_005417 [Neopestalotiopsis sp. 37M]